MPEHIKGLALTAAGVLVITPDSLLVRLISADQWTLIFWRGVLTGLALLAYLGIRERRRLVPAIQAIGTDGIMVAVLFAGSTIFFVLSLTHTRVANTLIVLAAIPLFAALLGRIFLGEAVERRTWAAIAAALVGLSLILFDDLGSSSLIGDLSAFATAFCVAGSFVAIRRRPDVNMIPAMALSGGMIALVALPLAPTLVLRGTDVPATLALGLVVLPLAMALLAQGPRYLPVAEVSLIMLLETVLGPYWVWLVIGERPSTLAFLGGAIVLSTLAAHALAGLRRTPGLQATGPTP